MILGQKNQIFFKQRLPRKLKALNSDPDFSELQLAALEKVDIEIHDGSKQKYFFAALRRSWNYWKDKSD